MEGPALLVSECSICVRLEAMMLRVAWYGGRSESKPTLLLGDRHTAVLMGDGPEKVKISRSL